jgi:hypothetical protein
MQHSEKIIEKEVDFHRLDNDFKVETEYNNIPLIELEKFIKAAEKDIVPK